MTTVVNLHVHPEAARLPEYVPVHRPTGWGNPFKIGRDSTRAQVIDKYRAWLVSERPDLVLNARIHLRDKVLGCYCVPLSCHAEVLARIANGESV